MKIQLGHAKKGGYEKNFYNPIKESVLYENHSFLFPHEFGKDVPNSKETLKNMDVFLCEVSSAGTGLGIEIGFASLYGVRIICMYKKGEEISGSLKYVTDEIFEYEDRKNMVGKLEEILG